MPEYPDIQNYLGCMKEKLGGQTLERVRIVSPFLVRTPQPRPRDFEGNRVVGFRRLGKRVVWEFDRGGFFVFHLMIAGRFRWKQRGVTIPKRLGLAAFDFRSGSILLTEAGTKKRASLHVVVDEAGLSQHDPGGLEVLENNYKTFRQVFAGRKNTIKRLLTDPRVFSGIGNAYSDEILHHAKISPILRVDRINETQFKSLYQAIQVVLSEWVDRLRSKNKDGFPEKVTAFHPEMAVHGKFEAPCPVCGTPVQRIRYAENECNYCPGCQTDGKLLADRGLSRLLKGDWPKSLEALEARLGSSEDDSQND